MTDEEREREVVAITRLILSCQNAKTETEAMLLKAEIMQRKESLKRDYRASEEAEGR